MLVGVPRAKRWPSSTEVGAGGAARERLESQGTAPGKKIYHPRARERVLQDAHPGLTHPVGGGAHPRVPRRKNCPPAIHPPTILHDPPATSTGGSVATTPGCGARAIRRALKACLSTYVCCSRRNATSTIG